MSIAPRLKLLTVCVGAAIAQMMAVPAMADSGEGVDTSLGNARNTGYSSGPMDPEYSATKHSPTGQLYKIPGLDTEEGITTEGGWAVTAEIEAGLLRSKAKTKNAIYDMYRASSNGLYVNDFKVRGEKADAARFFDLTGGSVGQKDQFYGMSVGRYNDWKVKAFYNETPHVFTTTFRNLWDGVGTGNLTVKPGLIAGGTGTTTGAPGGNNSAQTTPGWSTADNASAVNVANANANTELSLVRKKGGVRLDMNVMSGLKFVASYTNEKRKGARAFGMVAGIGGGGGQGTPFLEVPESIDYTTHDFLTGIQYVDERNSLNVHLTASIFKNNIGTETIQIPFRNALVAADGVAAGGITQGRFDLVPDNKAYNASAEYEHLLGLWNGRFNATVSAGTNRQDDALIAPSVNAVPGNATSNFSINPGSGGWNTTDALSQKTANAKINNTLVDLGLLLKPTDKLDVRAKVRQYETKNSTHYLACNPNATYLDNNGSVANAQPGGINAFGCNGVWGRIINDGAASMLFQPNVAAPATTQYIQNTPYDSKKTNYGLTADYKLGKFSSLNAALEREDVTRRFRERDKTYEDKVKLGYVNNGIEDATVRMSFEYDNRTGSQYTSTQFRTTQMSGALYPYLPANATAPVVLPAAAYQTTAFYETRRLDVADRRQHILNARLNYMVTPDLDAGLSGQFKRVRYPDALMGNSRSAQDSVNVDLTYQPSAELVISGFYAYQVGKHEMASSNAGIQAATVAVAPNPAGWPTTCTDLNNPGGCAIPYNRLMKFVINTKDRNNVLGLDATYDFGKVLLKAGVTQSRGVTTTGYQYSVSTTGVTPATGTGMPDMLFDQTMLDLNLMIPHNKKLTTKVLYHFETGRITDWHYTTIQNSPVASYNAITNGGAGQPLGLILDAGPQNYHVHAFGVFLDYKM